MPSLSGSSAKLIAFPLRIAEAGPARGPAEILFFTGIRYERAPETGRDDPDRPRDPVGGASAMPAASAPTRTRRPRRRA
jgi:hypothetical protein